MCAGRSCAACNANDLTVSCGHGVVARHLGREQIADTCSPSEEPLEARVPTKRLTEEPEELLADRIDVNPSDPESFAHFLETWAQIVRTRRCFSLIVQPGRAD